MLSQEVARSRVAKGAAYLDRVRPGWHTRIDVGTLTLHDPCGCIVGQLCGVDARTYPGAVEKLFGENDAVDVGVDVEGGLIPWSLKFDLSNPKRAKYYQPLQDAWIEEIARRLHPSDEATPIATPIAVPR